MNIRLRGLLIFAGSTVGALVMGWVLFYVEANVTKPTSIPAIPFALPLIGMLWGLLELITGRQFKDLDAWFQKIPMWIGYPVGCITLLIALIGCGALLMFIRNAFQH